MAEQEKSSQVVHAPYNFVGFPKKLLVDSADNAMRHDQLNPALKSGEIRITLTAETPVFVSDGNKDDPHFFRAPGGNYALPGSTVRGMVRENMQILSFAPVREKSDLDDDRLFFRVVGEPNNPIHRRVKAYYNSGTVMWVETKNKRTITKNVRAGWLCCEKGKDGKKVYRIYPTRKCSNVEGGYLRFPRANDPFVDWSKVSKEDYSHDAHLKEIYYVDSGNGQAGKVCRLEEKGSAHMQKGTLLYTGHWVGKQNSLYVFPEIDRNKPRQVHHSHIIDLDAQDILSYMEDFERRKNALQGMYGKEKLSFWKLPSEGESKPVFYVRIDGHVYFGMTLFLRIGYKYSLKHGLPYDGKKEVMDYPRAILGYADKYNKEKTEKSYRSRVSFSNCTVCGEMQEMPPISMILQEPKPSYYAGYVKLGKDGEIRHYSSEKEKKDSITGKPIAGELLPDFELRGFKQYWLKQEAVKPQCDGEKDSVITKIRPFPKNTKFIGTVRFKNLLPAELGLLLWSLRLEEECYQTIGMGKPYGYGRMKLTIDSMTEYSADDLYSGDLSAPNGVTLTGNACSEKVEKYIQQYDQKAAEDLQTTNRSLKDFGRIQDFFFMKRLHHEINASYMKLAQYQKVEQSMPTVQKLSGRPDDAYESVHSENEQEELDSAMLEQLFKIRGGKSNRKDNDGRPARKGKKKRK